MADKALPDPRVNFAAALDFSEGLIHLVGLEKYDLPSPYRLLYGLGASAPDPTISELAAQCSASLKSTSRVLKILIRERWVELVGDKKDTRKRRIRLTMKGQTLLKLVNGALVDMAFNIVSNVTGSPRVMPGPGHRNRIVSA